MFKEKKGHGLQASQNRWSRDAFHLTLIQRSFGRIYFVIFESYPFGKFPLTAITYNKLPKRHLNNYFSRQGAVCTVQHDCRKRVIVRCDVLRKAAGRSKRNQKVVPRIIFQAVQSAEPGNSARAFSATGAGNVASDFSKIRRWASLVCSSI